MAQNLYVEDGYVEAGWIQTGITVDWKNGVIFIPRASLTLVQSSPSFVYDLDLNQFRLTLRDLEEDVNEGRVWPTTHLHNTEITVGGTPLARQIILSDYYTVTFEDGQYAVNLKGANSNIGDRVNVNQVSIRPQNSAGLIGLDVVTTVTEEIYRRMGLEIGTLVTNNIDGSFSYGTVQVDSDVDANGNVTHNRTS